MVAGGQGRGVGLDERVWTRQRARRDGVSVRRLTGGQEFVRVAPAVYVEACWAEDLATRCAGVLRAAPTAVLSHWTALAVHGLPVPGAGLDAIHVTVPVGNARPRWSGVVGHRSGSVRPFLVDGLPVSGAVRAWCDAAALLAGPGLTPGADADLADLVAAGDALWSRRPSTRQDVGNQLTLRPGGRGAALARQALALLDPKAESAPESRLRVLLHLAGIAAPVAQHVVRRASGEFVARVDLAYPAARVAVEYDGDHHRGRRQWQQDLARRERLEGLGWRVVVVTAADLLGSPSSVVARVRAAVARAVGR